MFPVPALDLDLDLDLDWTSSSPMVLPSVTLARRELYGEDFASHDGISLSARWLYCGFSREKIPTGRISLSPLYYATHRTQFLTLEWGRPLNVKNPNGG
jgi:hypothetical protein